MRAIILGALCLSLAVAAEDLTWQEANRRSAEALRAGDERTGAAFARQSFDLYAIQSKRYSPDTHAQLLMNLVDAIQEDDGPAAALEQLDAGAAALVQRHGATPPVLASLWEQALRRSLLGGRPKDLTNRYYAATIEAASSVWGANDPRAIAVRARWAPLMLKINGDAWVREELQRGRQQAVAAGHEVIELALETALARLELERPKPASAAAKYEAVIPRLAGLQDPSSQATLRNALIQLSFAYSLLGDKEGEARTTARYDALRGAPIQDLSPKNRVAPTYPADALRAGVGGYVVFNLLIGPDGAVRDATLLDSFPRGLFEKPALDAILRWQFAPRPEAWQGEQRITFSVGN